MALLDRAMGSDEVLTTQGLKPNGNQCRRPSNEPIQHDRHPDYRRPKYQSRQSSDLQPANFPQNIEWIHHVGTMQFERPLNHCYLMPTTGFVDAGPASGYIGHRPTGHRRGDSGTWCRIADTHLTGADQADPLSHDFCRQFNSDHHGLLCLAAGHRRFHRQIVRALHDFSSKKTGHSAELIIDADIHHAHIHAGMLCQHIHAGPTPQKVQDHLRGDLPRIGAHPFQSHSVISGKSKDHAAWNIGLHLAGDGDVGHRQFFQAPETAEWFGQPIQSGLCLPAEGDIDRLNTTAQVLYRHDGSSIYFKRSDSPLTTRCTSSAAAAIC